MLAIGINFDQGCSFSRETNDGPGTLDTSNPQSVADWLTEENSGGEIDEILMVLNDQVYDHWIGDKDYTV